MSGIQGHDNRTPPYCLGRVVQSHDRGGVRERDTDSRSRLDSDPIGFEVARAINLEPTSSDMTQRVPRRLRH